MKYVAVSLSQYQIYDYFFPPSSKPSTSTMVIRNSVRVRRNIGVHKNIMVTLFPPVKWKPHCGFIFMIVMEIIVF